MSDSDKENAGGSAGEASSKGSATSATEKGTAGKGGNRKDATKKSKSSSKPSSSATETAEAASRRRRTPQKAKPQKVKSDDLNPVWWVPTMVTLMVVGLIWLVVCYLSQTKYPIPGIANWNLVIGFITIMAGFLMTTRWR